jgi:mono/diheme cytochrome c family protein
MRWFFLVLAISVVAVVYALGPRGEKFSSPPFMLFPDMDNQYKLKAQKPSEFFENGQGARLPVEGIVPLGYSFPSDGDVTARPSNLDYSSGIDYYNTGLFGDFYGKGFPEQVKFDEALLERGKTRFQISCSPCHGDSANGAGIVSKYWAVPPTANLLDPRVKEMPEGQIFWTITHGKGLMGAYNGVVTVHDRWAITAYLKGLQAASN